MNPQDDPNEFSLLPIERQDILSRWIHEHLTPRKKPNQRYTSYGLKHIFEDDRAHGGFYVSNGTFKGAMRAMGYCPVFEDDINWLYSFSFVKQHRR